MHALVPTFAVVGHPNKGKSSIVATLAQDDSVAISSESGTTRLTQSLDVAVGSSHYSLVDPSLHHTGLGWISRFLF